MRQIFGVPETVKPENIKLCTITQIAYEVGGISGDYHMVLEAHEPERFTLSKRIPIPYNLLEGEDAEKMAFEGFILWLSKTDVGLSLIQVLEPLTNIKMNLADVDEKLSEKHFYAKAIQTSEKDGDLFPIRFTAVPPEIDAYLQAFRLHAEVESYCEPLMDVLTFYASPFHR